MKSKEPIRSTFEERIITLECRMKELQAMTWEMDKLITTLNNKISMDDSEKRIKDLEQYRKNHRETTKFNHGAFCDILDRLKTLEESERTYHTASMQGWNNKHEDRIKALEEWKQERINADLHGPVLKEHNSRINALEEWKNLHIENLAQEWNQNNRLPNPAGVDDRIKDLEEWKQFCQGEPCGTGLIDKIEIPKQVWNDLKTMVWNIHTRSDTPNVVKEAFKHIIKSVEPDWDPDPIPDNLCTKRD